MTELVFVAPDNALWEQDGVHFPRPVTRFLQDVFPDGFIRGFQSGTACYGLLLDHLRPAFLHGFFFSRAVMVGVPEDAVGPPPREAIEALCTNHPAVRERLRTAATVFDEKPWHAHLQHWDEVLKPTSRARNLALQSQDLAPLSDAALAAHLVECFENAKAMVYQHHIYTVSCIIPVGDFLASAAAWTGLPTTELMPLLRGSTPISSGITDEYLAAVRAIAGDAAATALLRGGGSPSEVLTRVRSLPAPTGPAVAAYLDLASHRVIGGYDITSRTAIELPELLVHALQSGPDLEAAARVQRDVEERTARVRAAVPEPHRPAFDERLAEARLVNRLRDERAYYSDLWGSGIARRAWLEAGRRLFARGALEAIDHVLDAGADEVVALLTGAGSVPPPDAAELAARHAYRASVPGDIVPPFLNGPPTPPPPLEWFPASARRALAALGMAMSQVRSPSPPSSGGAVVRGIPVSAGIYEGRARVVLDSEGLASVRKGEVLVARSTSTAFNYVLPLVGAVVTDRGGLMSHAAIVAREYGLPGVVGCEVATKVIPDGARVRVDAGLGEVTLLS
ncbi:MAG TPA: PEP-utilizing enzyme [Casimicrobiaceae bacterium]